MLCGLILSKIKFCKDIVIIEPNDNRLKESLKVLISSLIFDFSEKGGVINRSNYNQYNYWERGSKKCYPTLEDLKINLNSYLLQDQNNKNISLDYYNSTIWVNKNYSKLYLLDLDDLNINYNFDINLSIPYPMALSSFEEILQEISFVSSSCNNNITCWGALFNATTKSIEIYPLNEGKTFNIEVTSQNMKDSLTNAEVVIKGAIDFEYNPLTQGEFEC